MTVKEKRKWGKATVREARQKRILPCMRGSHFQLREMQSQSPISSLASAVMNTANLLILALAVSS